MQPFIDTIASLIADRFYIQSGGNTLTSTATAEPQLYTDITQLKNQTLQQTSNTVAINPVLEVIKIGAVNTQELNSRKHLLPSNWKLN